jgi:sterol desaturase/sphingolipid hydroxylase (fatty acid hydroxylase superfamily)
MMIASLICLFSVLACLESFFPLRRVTEDKKTRNIRNISYFLLNSLLGRGLFIFLFYYFIDFRLYTWRELHQNYYPQLPTYIVFILLYIFYDFFIYLWHRLNHFSDFLFSFHQLHHADKNMDVSTGLRFHPAEYFFSYSYKVMIILFLGLDIQDILLFDSVLLIFSFLQHANIKLPFTIERVLGTLFITPRMHDIHHSSVSLEMNSFLGTTFVFWDRMFGTHFPYQEKTKTDIGLKKYPKTPSYLAGLFRLK